jgi:hypothetical protein
VLALGLAVLVGGGCGTTAGTPPASPAGTAAAVASSTVAQPLTRITAPPSRPPRVSLMAEEPDGGWRRLQDGVIYRGEWLKALRSGTAGRTVPWPSPVRLERGPRIAIAVPISAPPRTLTVRAFDGSWRYDGTPVGKPIYELECGLELFRSGQRGCSLEPRGDGHVLPLRGLRMHGPQRTAVNATWVVPPSSTEGDITIVWAVWLFATR